MPAYPVSQPVTMCWQNFCPYPSHAHVQGKPYCQQHLKRLRAGNINRPLFDGVECKYSLSGYALPWDEQTSENRERRIVLARADRALAASRDPEALEHA
ncbi:hypothetical protein [Aldersonia kunmingensis]|uniref:hypothetical protein n=1 Tax=Aldersonia kunmingensis TaxID=408066 RepID=UPI000AC787C9|nr:hypothetical protein [Aldersonia kunmingensis]